MVREGFEVKINKDAPGRSVSKRSTEPTYTITWSDGILSQSLNNLTKDEMFKLHRDLSEWVIERKYVEIVVEALRKVLDAIGEDFFVNDRGERDESILLSREEVAELCLDADRPVFIGGLSKYDYHHLLTLPKHKLDEIILEAFPSKNYGY